MSQLILEQAPTHYSDARDEASQSCNLSLIDPVDALQHSNVWTALKGTPQQANDIVPPAVHKARFYDISYVQINNFHDSFSISVPVQSSSIYIGPLLQGASRECNLCY